MRTEGTEYQIEIRSASSHLAIDTGKVAAPSGSTVRHAPARQVAKMSKTDRSKCSGAGLQTRSCSPSSAAAAAQSTNVSELRWEIITPFGVPVDPDVYRMYARSVSIARSSAKGSPDSPATATHGTMVAPWAGTLAAAPRSGRLGTPTTTTPGAWGAASDRVAAWDVLASSVTITAAPLSRTMWLSRPTGAFGSSGT